MRTPRKATAKGAQPARVVIDFDDELARGRTVPAKFRADSALLRELGERLVGRPHIALAELVKNAYDADATRCVITIESDRITVADNGHGMTKPEFLEYWMTIGTRNKERVGYSRKFKRPVTGSKGVGRLAAQFLAHKLQIITTPDQRDPKRLHAFVDWDEAVQSGSLTEAVAKHRLETNTIGLYPDRSRCGTYVLMEMLKQSWTKSEVRELGRQIWMLNAPVPNFGRTKSRTKSADDFRIEMKTDLPGFDAQFEQQMRQALENNQATIKGSVARKGRGAESRVTVMFDDGDTPSLLDRMMLADQTTYLPDDLLAKVDRASMAVSLEVRAPLLDHRIVEFSWRLPRSLKLRGATGKWILRQVLYRRVPRSMVDRPKRGFSVPIDRWLRGPLKQWAADLLSEDALRDDGLLDPAPIARAWRDLLDGRRQTGTALWAIVMFQAWKREWQA